MVCFVVMYPILTQTCPWSKNYKYHVWMKRHPHHNDNDDGDANDITHLEVDNEDNDLGDRSLQTEQVSVLDFHRLIRHKINNVWTNL